MKNKLYSNFWTLLVLLLIGMIGLNSCKDDDEANVNTPITVKRVFLENAQSSVPEREVTFARLGQVLRLEGSGFTGMQRVYINGRSTSFNPVFVTENSMLVQISGNTPTMEAEPDEQNTIRLEKGSIVYVYPFEIREAAPSVTGISHTMPQAGDKITIYGTGLRGITSVTFPGSVVVKEGIISDDEEGKFCEVVVPPGVSDKGGSLLVIGVNGGAYSSACFNFKEGLYQDFDNVDNYAWASGIDEAGTPLTELIPAAGPGPKSQKGYQCFNIAGNSIAANADIRYWTNSTDWPSSLLSKAIPASTSASESGVQMDIYVEGEWISGAIRMVMADGAGTDRYCMLYRPWYQNNAVVPFENPGCWFTVTFPFSDSDDYNGKTFGDVVTSMVNAQFKQSGPWFHNIGMADVFEPVATDVKVYFDNLRVVPLHTPTYSDFPEDEE
jgi:hypothetical protein